jgi:SAM-dependent methyltransferase
MQHVKCNVCGADDYRVLFPRDAAARQIHQIVRCNQCGLMYANPQEVVDCEAFAAETTSPKLDLEGEGRVYFEKQHVQMPDYERALGVLNEICPQRGRLLEVGSFLGLFLERCRATGWDVTGLEPYPPVATYARAKYGHKIVEALLPDAGLPEAAFDAVIMLHVIEHMPDPAKNVREARRILRPGGILVVETPRFDSLMFKVFGRRERSINNCHGHIYFFTVPTLKRLLEQCGFEVFRVDLVGRTLTLERLLYNLGVMTRRAVITRFLCRLGTRLRLNRFRVHVNVRDMQRLYCRAR